MDVGDEAAARGFAAEISYYLDHHMEGRDRESLDDLRDRCAERMDRRWGRRAAAGGHQGGDDGLARVQAFPDVKPALSELRERGLRLVIASNWDWSLPQWVERAGLDGLVDGTASSAVVGAAKPAPDVFREALRLAGPSRPRRSTWATRWRATSTGRAAPGSAPS